MNEWGTRFSARPLVIMNRTHTHTLQRLIGDCVRVLSVNEVKQGQTVLPLHSFR